MTFRSEPPKLIIINKHNAMKYENISKLFESNEIAERKNTYALNCHFDGLHVIHRLIESFKAKAVFCANECYATEKYTAQSIHILFRIQ